MGMRTVTVKEAAEALNISPRAVRDRINSGSLKGTQKENNYGVMEWRIYPTKEIAQKLNLDQESKAQDNDFPALEEAVDAEMVGEEPEGAEATPHQAWVAEERQNMRMLAEEMMKPLLATIRDQERQILEQGAQLKLLPDFQKQAEADRQMAIEKAMEAEALSKQIEALKAAQEDAEAAKQKNAELESALEKQQAELKAIQEQLQESQKPWWKKLFSAPPES